MVLLLLQKFLSVGDIFIHI